MRRDAAMLVVLTGAHADDERTSKAAHAFEGKKLSLTATSKAFVSKLNTRLPCPLTGCFCIISSSLQHSQGLLSCNLAGSQA